MRYPRNPYSEVATMTKTRWVGTLILLVAIGGTTANAGTATLQNENIIPGGLATIQLGFIQGDIGAAVLEASPGDYPITINAIQIIIADSIGGIDFRDYIITIYDNGNVNPGAPVYTSPVTTLAANAITELDVSAASIVINSGKFTVGASPATGGAPAEPNLVTDIGVGCQNGKNRIFDSASGLWFDACILGVTGQLGIRAVVDTSGGGGIPPQILVVVPDEGPSAGGTDVTVFGNDFVNGADVSFGGVLSPSVTFVNANTLDVVTPPHAGGDVDVEVCNPDLQCDTLVDGFNYLELECFTGTVGVDLLHVNGSNGGGSRTVEVAEGALVWSDLLTPPAGGNGKFVVHANFGEPDELSETVLPFQIGTFCFPLILTQGGNPDGVWNNLGKETQIGASQYLDGTGIPNPNPAPVIYLLEHGGDPVNLQAGTSVTFQGVIINPASPSPKTASTTNAVILKIL